jgi:glycosyltransferase involved in cell wall biosynthesis
MNKVTLSICIATRNRAGFIGATLESIVCQATDQVEIVVLDGASTDDTEPVVRRYQERFPRLRYLRQETNMGVDRDFATAVDLAQGAYCWLFSDDDVLKPGAIRVVLDAIRHDYALIIANAEVRNADLSEVLEAKRLPFTTNKTYKPIENQLLLTDTLDYLTFIGCVIIKRQVWGAREKEKYFGSFFIHVGIIFQRPLPDDALAIAEPLVSIRYGNAMWLNKYFEIWMFKWPGLVWSFADFTDSVKHRVCPKEPWRSLTTLLLFRAKGVYAKKEYAEWLQPLLESYWDRVLSRAIASFPGRAANLLFFVYFSIFRRPSSRRQILVDLANSPFCFWRLPVRSRTRSRTTTNVRRAAPVTRMSDR